MKRSLAAVLTVSASFTAGTALAAPRPLPFTYNYETLGESEVQVEQDMDLTFVKVLSTPQTSVWVPASQFQTNFEYGITSHLELSVSVTLAPAPNDRELSQSRPPLTDGNGAKERLRLRLFDEGVLPVDIGFYGELIENEREIEIAAKILLQKRFGNLRLAANIEGEHEWDFATVRQGWIVDPSAGVTYEATSVLQPGVDSWMWSEFTNAPSSNDPTPFNDKPNAYVGPAMLLDFGRFWWSTGAYIRITNLDHSMAPGQDSFGPLWFRTILGLTL